jgi:uncharacterized damage-inducible protein DinB
MTVLENLKRQFEYEFWANREELQALSRLPEAPGPAIRLLSHVLGAQILWLDRLLSRPARVAVWPELSLSECGAELQKSEAGWRSYLGGLREQDLASRCSYKNSKGEVFENRVLDVLTHVWLHSAYHRGQIAVEVRRAGSTPAYIDYIHAVRQGLLP